MSLDLGPSASVLEVTATFFFVQQSSQVKLGCDHVIAIHHVQSELVPRDQTRRERFGVNLLQTVEDVGLVYGEDG